LKRAIKKIRNTGIPISLVEVRPAISSYGLTKNQRKLLETAYERGFFDVPRKVDLRSLAMELGLSRSTIMESLRRAMCKILEEQFSLPVPPGQVLSNQSRRLVEIA
jgi:predicted DNA binding protein